MRVQQVVRELTALAEAHGIQVRYGRGTFRGGVCRIHGQPVIVLNRRHPPEIHVSLLVEGLRTLPLDTVYIRPALRQIIEQFEPVEVPPDDDIAAS